jgi:hypothetical protein
VYSGRLKTAQSIATIQVHDDTTVADVINAALDQFGLDPETQLAYRMIKVVIDKGKNVVTAGCIIMFPRYRNILFQIKCAIN